MCQTWRLKISYLLIKSKLIQNFGIIVVGNFPTWKGQLEKKRSWKLLNWKAWNEIEKNKVGEVESKLENFGLQLVLSNLMEISEFPTQTFQLHVSQADSKFRLSHIQKPRRIGSYKGRNAKNGRKYSKGGNLEQSGNKIIDYSQ